MRQILTDIVLPYLIFETIWTVVRWVLGGAFELDYTTASWTLWFLHRARDLAHRAALPGAAALAAAHRDRDLDRRRATRRRRRDVLALSRTFGMLPFFVFGWKLRQWQLAGRWLDLPSRVAGAGGRARSPSSRRCSLVMPIAIETWRDLRAAPVLLYDDSYQAIGYDEPWSGRHPARAAALRDAALAAFLVLMPRRDDAGSRRSARPRCTSTCCTPSCCSRSARPGCSRATSRSGCCRR